MQCIVNYNKKSFNNYQLEGNTKFLKIKNQDASSPYLSSELPYAWATFYSGKESSLVLRNSGLGSTPSFSPCSPFTSCTVSLPLNPQFPSLKTGDNIPAVFVRGKWINTCKPLRIVPGTQWTLDKLSSPWDCLPILEKYIYDRIKTLMLSMSFHPHLMKLLPLHLQ